MSHQLHLRVDRVEHWRPPYADGGPILTTLEVHDVRESSVRAADREGARLAFEHQGEGYTPARLVVHFRADVRDYEPGDYLVLSIEKSSAPEHDPDDGLPF